MPCLGSKDVAAMLSHCMLTCSALLCSVVTLPAQSILLSGLDGMADGFK